MSDGATILKAMHLGDAASTDEDVLISFAGKTFHVHSFVGTPYNGGALIIGADKAKANPRDLAAKFMTAACVCLASACTDIRDKDKCIAVLEDLSVMLADKFGSAVTQMVDSQARRPKPS